MKISPLSKLCMSEQSGLKSIADTRVSSKTYFQINNLIVVRFNDRVDLMTDAELTAKIIGGLKEIGFIDGASDVNFTDLKRFDYAYVIYDLEHKENTTVLRDYFKQQGIELNGRFGSFEYLNMDAIIRQSKNLAERF